MKSIDLKKLFLGKASKNDQLDHQKLNVLWGLPIMASDAVSSVAYAVEEILMTLVPVLGLASVFFVPEVSFPIIILLLLLVFSYKQIIKHYPNGGGAYIVAKENFGHKSSLLAASCLMVDYIMTVAVSISSATAAIVAAIPVLQPYKVLISLICVAIVTLINLRGISESSKIFGVPTYAFIISMICLIGFGFFKLMTGSLEPIEYSPEQVATFSQAAMSSITLVLFLHAFSSGCSALTGVEAVSNAIPNFKKPAQSNATKVLMLLALVIIIIFGGISFLASHLHVIPMEGKTVISQMANSVFGIGPMFYIIQFTTALILILAANTAYNGLPVLLSVLARDRQMPHQFTQRGTKLSFSNGIMFIAIISALLLIIFKADTHSLIPFYSVGVFISFTISQFGMFMKLRKTDLGRFNYKSLINAIGALVTAVAAVIVFFSKFFDGSWMLLILVPLMIAFMLATSKHYKNFAKEIAIGNFRYKYKKSESPNTMPTILLVHNMNRAVFKTIRYSQKISSNITALHISTTPNHTEKLKETWDELGIEIPLAVVDAPYRNIIEPLESYLSDLEKTLKKGENITVVLSKFVGNSLRDEIYHNQTAYFIEHQLKKHRNVVTVLVPYIYSNRDDSQKPS